MMGRMCKKCLCRHMPDYGACDVFRNGMNGMCVFCDHAKGCHPGAGVFCNAPLGPVKRATIYRPGQTFDKIKKL